MSEFANWRWSMAALAVLGAAGTLAFSRLATPARRRTSATDARGAVRAHLRDGGIVRLCLIAVLLMGGFVGAYNYLTYRLSEAPFRLGRRPVVVGSLGVALAGLALTLSDAVPVLVVGVVIFTGGFFGAHSVASGWTSARAAADKSQAAALYLMAYYLGSGIGGTVIGLAWSSGAWPATVAAVSGCYLLAAVIALGPREPI